MNFDLQVCEIKKLVLIDSSSSLSNTRTPYALCAVGFQVSQIGNLAISHLRLEHPRIIVRNHTRKLRQYFIPLKQDLGSAATAGVFSVAKDHVLDRLDFFRIFQWRQCDHLFIAPLCEVPEFIEHVGDTSRHPRSEIASCWSKHDHAAACHVLTTVIANRLNYCVRTAVAHAESLPRHPIDVSLAARRTIQRHIPDNDILFRSES